MPVEAEIVGNTGTTSIKRKAHVHPFETATGIHQGAVVLTHRLLEFSPEVHPFLNDTLGVNMAQNVTFGTVSITIHDGGTSANSDSGTADTDTTNHIIQSGQNFASTVVVGSYATATNTGHVTAVADTDLTCSADICPNGNEAFTIDPVWTGAAVAGTWDFADLGTISLTSANNNDQATFDSASTARYDWTNFTALTGKLDLTTFTPANHTIVLSFELNGVLVGNTVNLNDFVDTGDFDQQSFAISKVALGLVDGDLVNSLVITLLRSGGSKPTFAFDDLQLEASGEPKVFTATTPRGTRFHVSEIRIVLADNVTSIVTGSTTTYPTMPGLAYDALLSITGSPSPLANGIVFARVKASKTIFSVTFRQLGDFLGTGSNLITHISDGTNTFLTLLVEFPEPIILVGDTLDSLTFTINDNLSTLLQFTAVARGALEA